MFGWRNVWHQFVICELLYVRGYCPAVTHRSHCRHLSSDSGTWPRREIRNRRLSFGTLGTWSICLRTFHLDLVAMRCFLGRMTRRDCKHLTDALEDCRA